MKNNIKKKGFEKNTKFKGKDIILYIRVCCCSRFSCDIVVVAVV